MSNTTNMDFTERDSVDAPIRLYKSQVSMINEYWLKKKREHINEGMTPESYDTLFKERHKLEAKIKYPKVGMYTIEADGTVKYIG